MKIIKCLILFFISFQFSQTFAKVDTYGDILANKIKWSVGVYSANREYIEVVADAKEISKNYVAKSIFLVVGYFDANKSLINRDTIVFTDKNLYELKGGTLHRKFFKISYPNVVYVLGIKMIYRLYEIGVSYDHAPMFEEGIIDKDETYTRSNFEFNNSLPPISKEAYNGQYRLFVDGQEMKGLLIIKDDTAVFRQFQYNNVVWDTTFLLDEPSTFIRLDSMIKIKFIESCYTNTRPCRLEGIFSRTTANSIAGYAWVGYPEVRQVGFWAIKITSIPGRIYPPF